MTRHKPKTQKKVPYYWYDYEWSGHRRDEEIYAVIVESDHPDFPIVARFIPPSFMLAEKLIADLNAGRADPRKLAKELSI